MLVRQGIWTVYFEVITILYTNFVHGHKEQKLIIINYIICPNYPETSQAELTNEKEPNWPHP